MPSIADFSAILAKVEKYEAADVTKITAVEKKKEPSTSTTITNNANSKNQKNQYIDKEFDKLPVLMTKKEAEQAKIATELAYRLSLRTPIAKMDREQEGKVDKEKEEQNEKSLFNLVETISLEERIRLENLRRQNDSSLPAAMHEVELGDWESKIDWEGVKTEENKTVSTTITPSSSPQTTPHVISSLPDPEAILSETYNPELEALDLESMICWDGVEVSEEKNRELEKKMSKLILQDGVAGLSVAAKSGAISTVNPTPFNQSDVFKKRMENKDKASSGSVGKLQTDHLAREREIEERQKKRELKEIAKTNRIHSALGKLNMGGTGRRVTSSLMGPGGTERSGRPNKQNIASHDATYVEQLDFINNHVMVKSFMTFGELRHFHRPVLPRKIFKPERIMPWQFQVRIFPSNNLMEKKKGRKVGADGALISSYQSNLPIAQKKIRNGSDLSPTEGSLVIIEYSEEMPPIQMTKGMTSKIVNYYRGDRSKCPVSAGGGDRPLRKKKHGNMVEDSNVKAGGANKIERPPRLISNANDTVIDLIGKIPKSKRSSDHSHSKEPKYTILPEGTTEILHAKDQGPFIGQIKDGETQTGLISNLFAAPLFRHEAKNTDFLLIIGKIPTKPEESSSSMKLPVYIRPMPTSVFVAGQVEPKTKVHPPESKDDKQFFEKFAKYHIAKALQKKQIGLRLDDITQGLFPLSGLPTANFRTITKKVAHFDTTTSIWTLKEEPDKDFESVEALSRAMSPEGVAAYWTAQSTMLRLQDLGIYHLYRTANGVSNLHAALTYLNGQVSAARKRLNHLKKKKKKGLIPNDRLLEYEEVEKKLTEQYDSLKRKGEVATFIYEELQLASWKITGDFIDVHKKGNGEMQLTGLGDPSGINAAYNFVRKIDKEKKVAPDGDGALNARVKKITGTENDLRKLNMKQMADILRSYGMEQKQIKELKRWDRVHCIRDLSTKAASDNMGDGLERFARGEKLKLRDQQKIYNDRIQEIWHRQKGALQVSDDSPDMIGRDGVDRNEETPVEEDDDLKKAADEDEDDEDEEDDDDFFNEFQDEFDNTGAVNELVSNQLRSEGGKGKGIRMQGDNRDAMELAAFKKQEEEDRIEQMNMDAISDSNSTRPSSSLARRGGVVIRRKITKTNPDGTQTVKFKFFIEKDEVEKVMNEKKPTTSQEPKKGRRKGRKPAIEVVHQHDGTINPVGHALFEEEYEDGIFQMQRKRRGGRGRSRKQSEDDDFSPMRAGRKAKAGEKKSKRKRSEDDEYEILVNTIRRKGTTNRKERGAARERMPHVMFADRLEQIRLEVEKRPNSGPFHRPVARSFNKYYEKIKKPIDLSKIRDKIQRYDYRAVYDFTKDFELMKDNAIAFNGIGSHLAKEAACIYDYVKLTIEQNQADFDQLEVLVEEQMTTGRRSLSGTTTPHLPSNMLGGQTANVMIDGENTTLNLGNIQGLFNHDDSD